MTGLLPNYIIPGALSIMPAKMRSREAGALLYAIALQESKASFRTQIKGPAVSLWQFELVGIEDVIDDGIVGPIFDDCVEALLYRRNLSVEEVSHICIHNDFVSCVIARLKLWKLPSSLPREEQSENGWAQYTIAWKPGKPHKELWNENFRRAWNYFGGSTQLDIKNV